MASLSQKGLGERMPLARKPSVRYDVAMSVGEGKRRRKGRKAVLLTGTTLLILLGMTAWFSWDHIRFWWLFEPLGSNEQVYPEYRHRETGIVMVRVPGGTFMMGSPEDEAESRNDEHPEHQVTMSSFLIGKYEVSQAEWDKVMGSNPAQLKGDNRPVETVSWEDCQEFCLKLGLSLPTEAQWEYACRAGSGGPFAGTGRLDDMGWWTENSGRRLHAVGEKEPNDFGLYDMQGNVWEWCEDVYDEGFYARPEAMGPDPVGPHQSHADIRRR